MGGKLNGFQDMLFWRAKSANRQSLFLINYIWDGGDRKIWTQTVFDVS